jgi:hypothetical protein
MMAPVMTKAMARVIHYYLPDPALIVVHKSLLENTLIVIPSQRPLDGVTGPFGYYFPLTHSSSSSSSHRSHQCQCQWQPIDWPTATATFNMSGVPWSTAPAFYPISTLL